MNKLLKFFGEVILGIFIVFVIVFVFGLYDYITTFEIEKNSKIDNVPINETYNFCKNETDNKFYIQCINNYFKQRINPESKNDFSIIKDDWEGDCLTATVFYKNLLDKRNIPNEIVLLKHHAFIVIDFGYDEEFRYCILDQMELNCF